MRATATMGPEMTAAITGLLMPPLLIDDGVAVAEIEAVWATGVMVVVATVMTIVAPSEVGGMTVVTTALLVINEVAVDVGVGEALIC